MSLAIVERPISAIPEQRGHESPEIIDVDLFDVEEVARIGSRPPTRRRRVSESGRSVPIEREVITVNDSDDDDIQFVSARPAPRPHRAPIFSPSPPPQLDAIPPVPQIPRRFIPMRRRPPPFPTAPGLVVPHAEPFPFETNIRPAPAPIERPPAPAPAVAPSHHVPVMGFGGALLQRARAAFEQPPARSHNVDRRRRVFGIPADVFMQWNPLDFFGHEEDELYDDDGFRHYRAADFHDEPGDRLMRGDLRLFNAPGRLPEPDYKPEYTHPMKPASGFTHDFELSVMTSAPVFDIDSPGSSSSSSSRSGETMLACPRCHDPLMLGAADVAEDRAKRRLWGLRCGHLLDGKCVEELMKPIPLVISDLLDTVDVKGKGKAKGTDELELPGAYSTHSVKGKGKETESDIFNIFPEPEFSSIRSRLRPRPPLPSHPSGPSPAGPGPSRVRSRAAPRPPVKAKTIGKGRAKVSNVEAEYEWSCPVGGCGHIHVSQLIDGEWVMDEKRGAITVFV
ncbi:hypothetical protein DEU56DRAFT_423097 [Suillus clintonianus]|uniref:uncharacterized protein n=1 Tax=Suillus clintonianus TaxID=1904413 RepID=UPI001B87F84F|nr:uncharacterized protein DEU56DRAFT_423097 [Suillus clintonianus]KAG2132977.1 hypothetical protein DEU56DRAFT_423097 [Suillus clintonianus]